MDGWNRGNIYGTYVHGIFDSPGIARTVAEALAAAKGLCLEQAADMDYRTYRQQQYDKLAESLRETSGHGCRVQNHGHQPKRKRRGEAG